jgi:ribosome-binding protein aMBF1 (putative translation factor)
MTQHAADAGGRADAVQTLHARYIGEDPEKRAMVARAHVEIEIGQLVYDARIAAGLTQKELADRVGTTQSAISRLEDADYNGHSLSMLGRVASVLGRRVRVDLVNNAGAENL